MTSPLYRVVLVSLLMVSLLFFGPLFVHSIQALVSNIDRVFIMCRPSTTT